MKKNFLTLFSTANRCLKYSISRDNHSYLALNTISIIASFKIYEINSWINYVTENTRLEAEATPGYVTLESRMTERHGSIIFTFLSCSTCVFQRGQKNRLFTRGSDPATNGNGPSAVSVGGPFRNLGADTLIHRLRVTS